MIHALPVASVPDVPPDVSIEGIEACRSLKFLGVDRDGACTSSSPCQPHQPSAFRIASLGVLLPLAEPVAAALAVLKADIHAGQSGIIVGDDRISQLVLRVLRTHGFERVQTCGVLAKHACCLMARAIL